MAHFDLIRKHEADGTVDHVLEFFLVDANGKALLQYMGEKAEPDRVASDVEKAVNHEPVAESDGDIIALIFQAARA